MYNMAIKEYVVGSRVELTKDMVQESNMPKGLQGTVIYLDDYGHVGVKWDNGRTLNLIQGVDSFKVV